MNQPTIGGLVNGKPVPLSIWFKGWKLSAPVGWQDWRRTVAARAGARLVVISLDDDDELTVEVVTVVEPCKRGRTFEDTKGDAITLTRIVGALANLSRQQTTMLIGAPVNTANVIRHDQAWLVGESDGQPIYYFDPDRYEAVRPRGLSG